MTLLEALSPPASLVDLPELKTELRITGDEHDAKLRAAISTAARLLAREDALGFPPARQRWREQLPGSGGLFLTLSRRPVESVVSITVDDQAVDGFELAEAAVYHASGWQFSCDAPGLAGARGRQLTYAVEYIAGWLGPAQVTEWQPDTDYSVGSWVQVPGTLFLLECRIAGRSNLEPPSWPETPGQAAADGSAVWQTTRAQICPDDLYAVALAKAKQVYRRELEIPVGIEAMSDPGGSVRFSRRATVWSVVERAIVAEYSL